MRVLRPRALPLFAVALLGTASLAHAERPLSVDDAGTLDKGGAKLEAGWSKDDEAKGYDAAAGFSPIETLELEIGFGRSRDFATAGNEATNGQGLALKWVPLQSETGLSAGLKYEYGRDRTEGESAYVNSLTGLLTWTFEGGQMVHTNLGREVTREDGDTDAVNTWGVAVDLPLTEKLSFVAETFGNEDSRPDRAIGLRYEIIEGVKISAAVGHGNDRSFANAGIGWEF